MIRPLGHDDADAYAALRRAALLDAPLAFAAAPGDDFVSSADAVRQELRRAPDWVLLGAFDPGLVGAVGLMRDRHLKSSHKAHLWGMYVAPGHRGRGVGAELVQAAIAHARTLPGVSWVHLGVSAAAPAARRLYERAGFLTWGVEADALRHDGESVAEHHMALRLDQPGEARPGLDR
jgi:RimJ/RimL family protein N-acetyltransferase